MRYVLLAATLVMSSPAYSGSVDLIFQSVITKNGKSCPRVTASEAIGTVEGGDALIAVACSNGDRHVLRLDSNDNVSYVSSCAIFESQSGVECF